MSFTPIVGEVDSILCYYILTKDLVRSAIVGRVSQRGYSYQYIQSLFPGFIQEPTRIIYNIPEPPNGGIQDRRRDEFIVGIPNRNGNNLSRRDIFRLMNTFNIGALRDIRPYIKLAGNDTTTSANPGECIPALTRKLLTLKYKNTSSLRELTSQEARSMIDNLGIANRICLSSTKYSNR